MSSRRKTAFLLITYEKISCFLHHRVILFQPPAKNLNAELLQNYLLAMAGKMC